MIFDRLLNRVIACLHVPRVTEKVAARYKLLRGDLNYDGTLTPADAAIALRIAASGAQNHAADVSGGRSDNTMKTLVAAMVLAVLFATAAAQAGVDSKSSSTGSIPVELCFDSSDLSFDKYSGYDLISVPGCRFTREIGKPALPVKSVFVALPANSELTGIEVVSCRTKTLSGKYVILPAQPPIPTMAGAAAGFVPPGSVYDSSYMYPDAVCGGESVGSLRGYKILSFRVFPLQYSPAERRLILHEEIILDVRYETPRYAAADAGDGDDVGAAGMTGREDDEFYRIAAGLVANPGDVSRAMPTTRTITKDRIMPLSKSTFPDGNVEYVIITSDSLEDEFQRLADWKTKKGVPATVVNTSWIEGSYAGTGVDTQERIRNFINDAYTAWDTKWVLLGGDTDIIPCRGGYGLVNGSAALAEESYEDKAIPADLYYSDLDGNWDANGNLIYGEVNDSVDLYPDVFVGRAPVDSIAEARTFVNKTLRYEKNPPPDYTQDILFLAEYLDAETDGGDTKDIIEADCMFDDFSLVKLYERYGNLSKGSAVDELNRGCNIVNHIGHGWHTGFCVGSGWIGLSDAGSLTNSPRNFILYTMSCNSNNFEEDSVSERYMNNEDGGSVGYIGNSRYGWYDPELPPGEGPSDLYDREFFNITLSESAYRLGEVVGYSKVRYIPDSQEDGTAMRWLQYAINLLGDPELPIRTETPRNFSISMPAHIPARKQTLVINVSEIGHDHGSVQVRNATVCIRKSGEVYNVSMTGASGLARFTIDPDAGGLDVTVTKENYRVYEGAIDIYAVPDIYVNTTGWWRDGGAFYANGTPIQSAVDGADAGEMILVRNGSYTENVDVDKTLTLRGEGADVVTVTAADSADHVFEVSADWVNLSGFAVRGAVDCCRTAGVHLNDTDHCNISGNNASNNDYGICLYSSDNNTLTDNIASNNNHGVYLWYSSNNNRLTKNNASSNGDGICLSDSRNNTLTSNIASNNHFGIWLRGDSNNNTLANNTANLNSHHGIYLLSSCSNMLTNNTISKNNCNFGVYGSSLSEHIHSIDASNMVDGKPIYYRVDQENETIPYDAGFVGVVNCTNMTVRDLTLMKNRDGVLFAYTNDSRIVNVTSCLNEYHGICLFSSSNNTLANNTVSNNVRGIYMYRSSYNIIEKNTASNNHDGGFIISYISGNNSVTIPGGGDGIFLYSSSSNNITCNLLQNNTNRGFYLEGGSMDNNISCNNIIENGNYNATTGGYEWQLFHLYQTGDIDASDNWWGTANESAINASIYGWNGNLDVSNATYLPVLGQPATCAPEPERPAFTTTDAAIALAIAAGSRPPDPRWDVSGDGSVTSLDALMILQVVAGVIEL